MIISIKTGIIMDVNIINNMKDNHIRFLSFIKCSTSEDLQKWIAEYNLLWIRIKQKEDLRCKNELWQTIYDLEEIALITIEHIQILINQIKQL
jgi:hypothetical protein